MTQAWYPFYWSDYSGKTMHLTMGQHGAYMLFLRWVYTTEKPIPHKQCHSIARAMTEQERGDADFVLNEFFVRDGDVWRSNRAEKVIEETKGRHEKRVNAGKKGGIAKAERSSNATDKPEQCPSNALVTTTTTTTIIDNKENKDKENVGKSKTSKSGTLLIEWFSENGHGDGKIPDDWIEWIDRKYKWDDATIAHVAGRFFRYFTGPDAKNPRKRDWKRAFQNWCDGDISSAQAFIRSNSGAKAGETKGYTSAVVDSAKQAQNLIEASLGAKDDDIPNFENTVS